MPHLEIVEVGYPVKTGWIAWHIYIDIKVKVPLIAAAQFPINLSSRGPPFWVEDVGIVVEVPPSWCYLLITESFSSFSNV